MHSRQRNDRRTVTCTDQTLRTPARRRARAGRDRLLSCLAALALLALAAARPAADTIVNADIQSDTTWTTAGSPYIVTNNIAIQAGATLTVRPGVIVRFNALTGLDAYGRLVAEGAQSQPILFTASTATPGSWSGINLIGEAAAPNVGSRFRYATIEYGGSYYANLYLIHARASVRNCTIRQGSADGLYGGDGGIADIEDTIFSGNAQNAVLFEDGAGDPLLVRLTASGNGADAVRLGGGTILGKATWENGGLPYVVGGTIYIDRDALLYVQPGVIVRFEQDVGLTAYGRLLAVGAERQPILFTGTQPLRGWWSGISIIGTPDVANAGSILTHATVEYGGGYYGNLYIDEGQVAVSHGIIRQSAADGIYLWYGGAASVVELSQIIENAGYAIQHNNAIDPANMLLAAHNWWGHASGPLHAACNPTGQGGPVSDGVAFLPYLAAPDEDPGPVAPGDARLLAITPRRWFAPADGLTRVWVAITLRDGAGNPLAGRTVRLNSDLDGSTVVDGGVTDPNGETLAYLTSNAPGDAALTASLDFLATCESARSPSAKVTFTAPAGGADLMPDAAAPYLSSALEISPLPIVRGVPTMLRATLTNSTSAALTVDASFSISQYGIGLAFGPLAEVQDRIIPASSTAVIAAAWTPVVSGYYCLEFLYTAQPVQPRVGRLWPTSGRSQSNVQAAPGPMGSPDEKEGIARARRATDTLDDGNSVLSLVTDPLGYIVGYIPDQLFDYILDFNYRTWNDACEALGGDPPRQDYNMIAVPEHFTFTLLAAGPDLSAERAAAANALMEAALEVTANLRAATLTLDRYAGAAAAGDTDWAARQAAALLLFKHDAGAAMARAADRLDALQQVTRNEGVNDMVLTADTARAYQQRLQSQGFTALELQAARTLNLTDAQIQAIRQERIAADPERMAGSLFARLTDLAVAYRELGAILQNPPNFPSDLPAAGPRRAAPQANRLLRVFETVQSFGVRNPLASTATVELRIRRVDLPGDWMVDVAPTSVTLGAGAQTTATVSVRAGAAAVQGTRPRVAVEGYANGQLIGGVALDVLLPRQVVFEPGARVPRWKMYR